MAARTQRAERRTDALSKERIVEAATGILDADGENALTFRALAARLATGAGAIYSMSPAKTTCWRRPPTASSPGSWPGTAGAARSRDVNRGWTAGGHPGSGLGMFDAINAHPWVGAELSREPWQFASLRILEGFGQQFMALGVPARAQFDCASALLNYVLGLAGQYAAGARLLAGVTDRSTSWPPWPPAGRQLDPAEYPFVRQMAARLPGHDDREQFLAGIDLILAGITTAR